MSSENARTLTITIFGATGDLARKKLYPAMSMLFKGQHLNIDEVNIVGYGRRDQELSAFLTKQCVNVKETDEEKSKLFERCTYFRGLYDNPDDFKRLDAYIASKYEKGKKSVDRIFFLAIPPTIFGSVCEMLSAHCKSASGFTRVIIEKPFGRDSETYAQLREVTDRCFKQEQVYRIDHYLGKEVVMNLLVLRNCNPIFSFMWDRKCIESVQIRWKEDLGLKGRGGYFDKFGIIRDIMQNHLLQVLMFIAMEPPKANDAKSIIEAKTNLLKCIDAIKMDDVLLGQFTRRTFKNYTVKGDDKIDYHEGYLDDPTVPNDSTCPTFAMMGLHINNERWQGVPFTLSAGKGLDERLCEVRVTFKKEKGIFNDTSPNELVIRIQPDEAIYFKVMNKAPGIKMGPSPAVLDLSYKQQFKDKHSFDAYARMILNCAQGDQSLFVGSEELTEAWRIFTPILHEMEEKKVKPILYPFGSRGPEEVDEWALKRFNVKRKMSWQEWVEIHNEEKVELKKLFDTLDKNSDGTIVVADVEVLLKTFNDGRSPSASEIDKFMRQMDKDGDGSLSFEEFCHGVSFLCDWKATSSRSVNVCI